VAAVDLLHPDILIGSLSEILRVVAQPVANTLDDLPVYEGLRADQLFPEPSGIPEVTVQSRWRFPGIVSEDIVFRSQHVPLERKFRRRYEEEYPETHVVYARRVAPVTAARRPRLLYLHGYMQPETYLEELGVLVSMALFLNVEVIQLQPPYHGRRSPRTSWVGGELFMTADLVRSVEALRQSVLDARTLLRILQHQDPRPVGVAGISLGGALSLALTCTEERFAFAVPLIAHMDLEAMVADVPVLRKMRRDLRAFGWDRARFARFVEGLGWYDLAPKLPVDRILLAAASQDRFFEADVVEAMWRRWGEPEIHWYPCSHMGFLPRLPEVLSLVKAHIENCSDAA